MESRLAIRRRCPHAIRQILSFWLITPSEHRKTGYEGSGSYFRGGSKSPASGGLRHGVQEQSGYDRADFRTSLPESNPAFAGRKGLGLGLYIGKELAARHGGQIWARSALGQGRRLFRYIAVFSLRSLVGPALTKEGHMESPITIVVTEIGSQIGWLSDKTRAEQSQGLRDLRQGCLHSDLEVLLPKMGLAEASELFFMVAIIDGIDGEAITKRIREELNGSELNCVPSSRSSREERSYSIQFP